MAVYGIREEPLSVQQPNPLRNYAALTIRRNSATAGTSPTGFGPSPQFGSPGSFERHEFSSTMARLEAFMKRLVKLPTVLEKRECRSGHTSGDAGKVLKRPRSTRERRTICHVVKLSSSLYV